MEENVKVEVKSIPIFASKVTTYENVKIYIDDKVYDSGKTSEQFGDQIFECFHEPKGWLLQLGFSIEPGKELKHGQYTLSINNTNINDMPEAPERERAALARSKIINKMDGPIKSANFYILRKGEPTRVSVTYNTHTKFAKLCVGKHVVSAKQQKGSKDLPFPLALAVVGLSPLVKVWVNYEPLPKNAFQIKVNDEDLHYLLKEEFDEDPSKTEQLWIALNINDNEDSSGYAGKQWAILGATPWIIEDVEDKI